MNIIKFLIIFFTLIFLSCETSILEQIDTSTPSQVILSASSDSPLISFSDEPVYTGGYYRSTTSDIRYDSLMRVISYRNKFNSVVRYVSGIKYGRYKFIISYNEERYYIHSHHSIQVRDIKGGGASYTAIIDGITYKYP